MVRPYHQKLFGLPIKMDNTESVGFVNGVGVIYTQSFGGETEGLGIFRRIMNKCNHNDIRGWVQKFPA